MPKMEFGLGQVANGHAAPPKQFYLLGVGGGFFVKWALHRLPPAKK